MNKSFDFRPDIEGLRAIAVMLVVLYHAGFTSISGGFIGVDIFFVISGFLLTKIIHSEIKEKSFSFRGFYSRRLRRIAPLLISMITLTSLAATYILTPADLILYAKSATSSLLSVSNLFFWNEASGYFAQSAEQLPLIHTWSLSIEEQFYILLPLALVFCSKHLNSKSGHLLFAVIFFSSFGYSIWSSNEDSISSYYLLSSRAFELMIGSALALTWNRLRAPNLLTANLIRAASLLTILTSALTINKATPFPGLAALLPCLAAALIIYAGKCSATWKIDSYFLISNAPTTYIGKLSYSLYLWHWPIVAFVHYQGIDLDLVTSLSILALSFALSIVSFYLIETPFRKAKNISFNKIFIVTFAGPLAISCISLTLTVKSEGFKQRFSDEIQSEFSENNSPVSVYKNCFNSYKLNNADECSIGKLDEPISGMFLGDSMAGHYIAFMDEIAKDAKIKLFTSSASGLPPFHVKNYPYFESQRSEEKLRYNEERIAASMKYKIVFIAASWANGYPYLSENEPELFNSIDEYLNRGIKVFLISRPNTITDEILNSTKSLRINGQNISDIRAPIKDSNEFLRKLTERYPEISVIDPNEVICSSDGCKVSIDNKTLYSDSAHINNSGSRRLGEIYLNKKGNPLKEAG